jgi:hypothetical protein
MDRDTNVTMPELLREASPFLRNIIIFRNPADRYYSAFYYYRWAAVRRSRGFRRPGLTAGTAVIWRRISAHGLPDSTHALPTPWRPAHSVC